MSNKLVASHLQATSWPAHEDIVSFSNRRNSSFRDSSLWCGLNEKVFRSDLAE